MQIKCTQCKKNFRIKLHPGIEKYIKMYKSGQCNETQELMYFPFLEHNIESKHAYELITRNWCFDCWHDSWAKGYGYCPLHKFPKNK